MKYEPLRDQQAQILARCAFAELGKQPIVQQPELPFLTEIVKKRIEGLKLPIKFTDYALLAVNAFAKNPGEAVIVLIDALEKYEGEEVTTAKLCQLYPAGFYTRDSVESYIDDVLKPKLTKWSKIY